MGIKHPCHPGNRRRYGKGHELIFCNINSGGLRCNAVVAYGHDGTAIPGINQVQDNKQGKENQEDSYCKAGIVRSSGYSLCPVYNHLPFLSQMQGDGILHGKMKTVIIFTDIKNVYQVLYNFPKSQGNNSQIIPFQPQYRNAN